MGVLTRGLFVLFISTVLMRGLAAQNRDLASMSLEELSQVDVTSFRNKAQKMSQVAGAVYVITRERIERSGLNSVPELLRMVPGLHVAQVNGGQWSVSSRGAVGVMQPRLLVLIDGRSIYTPIFSGVFWDMGMPMLDDIDRIEVIRGPGATIWGMNAMLGVINIVTRNSRDTQETLVVAGGGTSERAMGRVRFGGTNRGISWRGYVLAEDRAAQDTASGTSAGDGWHTEQAGFRMDARRERNSWMLEGAIAANHGRLTNVTASLPAQGFIGMPMDMLNATGHLTGEYRRTVGKDGELRVNGNFDQVRRQNTVDRIAHTRTWNGDLRYDLAVAGRHSVSVGAGVRAIQESVPGAGGTVYFTPSSKDYAIYNAFAQDEIALAEGRVLLTFGAKVEHNAFTGWGAEPSASALWKMSERHSVWVSGARALRTPSFVERSIFSPLLIVAPSAQTSYLPLQVDKRGSEAAGDEALSDLQIGYRGELSKTVSVSVSLYRDWYHDFRSVNFGTPAFQRFPIPSLVTTAYSTNNMTGNGKGAETTLAWQPWRTWKLEGSHTYALPNVHSKSAAPQGTMLIDSTRPPLHQWVLHSAWNPATAWEADLSAYWNGHMVHYTALTVLDAPSSTRIDIRLGYKATERWTLSVVGQNLLRPRQLEGIPEALTGYSYIRRGMYVKSVWRF